MSVFKVQLNNIGQGLLDMNPATGGQIQPSLQRTVYIMGPGKTNRKLFDGATFTDSNYFKRFCFPNVPYDQAIMSVVTDDGSVYLDSNPVGSTYPKTFTLAPVINSVTAGVITTTATGFAANNVVDILGLFGSAAVYSQMVNSGTVSLKMRLNGDVNAVLDLAAGSEQIFNNGDAIISKIEFGNASGSTAGAVQVTVSIASNSNS